MKSPGKILGVLGILLRTLDCLEYVLEGSGSVLEWVLEALW